MEEIFLEKKYLIGSLSYLSQALTGTFKLKINIPNVQYPYYGSNFWRRSLDGR